MTRSGSGTSSSRNQSISKLDVRNILFAITPFECLNDPGKLFLSKTRIESIWYHESENFSIVSSDAITQGNTYVKTSLFCYAKAPFYRGNSAKSLNNEVSFLSNTYSVDIGSSETDRVQLEVQYTVYCVF